MTPYRLHAATLATAALLAAFAAQMLPTTASAQIATRNPAEVKSGQFAVEPYHTRILFGVNHMGFTTYYGDFSGASGSLTLAPKGGPATALSVSVPVDSVSTTNAKLDGLLKSDAWLDAARFPTMTFTSTSITPTGPSSARVAGNLTLHGVTRPETLSVKFNGAGVNILDQKYTVGFDATGIIKRSDFGVVKYLPLIGDPVTLTISAAFEKQG